MCPEAYTESFNNHKEKKNPNCNLMLFFSESRFSCFHPNSAFTG